MTKNLLNKNLIIYKISIFWKTSNNFLILITPHNGWIIFPLYNSKNKQLESILFGYNRLYKFFFKVKGFGFKWKYQVALNKLHQTVFLKLGYTHKIALLPSKNHKYLLKKKRFIIKSRSYTYIRNNLNMLFLLYKTYLYNKKGIYLRGTKFKLKLSKKKSKF